MRSLLLIVGLCLLPLAPGIAAPTAPITVYAAASLKESLDAVAAAWQAQSGQKVRISYAASSLLARQIEQGAPVDVMFSADSAWMDHLQQAGLVVPATRVDLLGNRLVLIAPSASSQRRFDLHCAACWNAALGDRRLSLAEPRSVPAGRYAQQALDHLGVWPAIASKLAASDNVRAAMAFVARGEAPLGIVYATDARVEAGVRVLEVINEDLHEPIVYPYARVASAPEAASREFLQFLRGAKARSIFEQAGFDVIAARGDVQR